MLAQELDIRELKRQRNAKKRRRFAKKLIAVSIIVLIGALIYTTRSKWLPFFDGIATRYLPTSQNTGELAVGKFPLKVSGASSYQVGTLENSFAVVDDTHFYIYSTDGKNLIDIQHQYSNPILDSNSKKALVYDIGGNKFRVESKYKTLYTQKSDDTIVFAKISNDDKVAIVTKSDKFVSVMTIYDGSGKEIFRWKSIDSRIIDVTFNSTNDGCVVTTIDANGGQLVSKLYRFNFNKNKEIWISQNIDTMIISTKIRDDGTIVAFGDTKCAYYSNNGEYIGSYSYKSKLIDYDCSNTTTALLFENEERRKSSLVLINDIKSDIKTIEIDDAKHVSVNNDKALVMTDNKIDEYSNIGTLITDVKIDDSYSDFRKIGNYVLLLGYSDINRIDFNG